MAKDKLSKLKEKYGYNKASYKYILPGAEILKYIGQTVVLVEFSKGVSGEWINDYKQAVIEEIDGFNPLTMIYTVKYHTTDKPDESLTFEMIPEGFSFGNPEDVGYMKRFVPLSIHYTMVEDELFYSRLDKLYKSRDTISLYGLKTLSESKEIEKTLKYCCNIGAIFNTPEGILYTRIKVLRLTHKNGNNYSLYISNEEDSWSLEITSSQKEYTVDGVGTLKLIDLRGK